MTEIRNPVTPPSPVAGDARDHLPRRVFVKPSSVSNASVALSIAFIAGLLALAYLLSQTPSG